MNLTKSLLSLAVGAFVSIAANATPTPVATWDFNNTLAANQVGVPALTPIDPLGQNAFVTDTVFGNSRTVYQFSGNRFPVTDQAGLSVSTTGLLTNGNAYSVDMIFKFDSDNGSWKNIFGVSNRTSDNAFYVEPGNHLQIYPTGNGIDLFTFDTYHRLSLTNDGSDHVNAYLDGVFQFNLASTVMDFSTYSVDNPTNLIDFFADNVVGGGQGEFASGSVAQIRLYNEELTGTEVGQLPTIPPTTNPVPEPGSLLLVGLGLAGLSRARRRQ